MNEMSKEIYSTEQSKAPGHNEGRQALLFIVGAIGFAAMLLILNTFIMAKTIGYPTADSQQFCDKVASRVDLTRDIKEPNLVIIGGSGVRAGFSAEMMSKSLGASVVNFGLQASFGPDLILSEARRALKPGDTALLAFEYKQYTHDAWNPIELDYGMGCAPDWLRSKSPTVIFEALMATELSRLVDVVSYAKTRDHPSEPSDANAYGDRLASSFAPLSSGDKHRLSLYQPVEIKIDPDARGTEAIREFIQYAKENNIRVLATWPNTIDFPEYKRNAGFEQIRTLYESQGVQMVGKPELGLYPLADFYDTQYHLNFDSIKLRTRDFLKAARAEKIDLAAGLHPYVKSSSTAFNRLSAQ